MLPRADERRFSFFGCVAAFFCNSRASFSRSAAFARAASARSRTSFVVSLISCSLFSFFLRPLARFPLAWANQCQPQACQDGATRRFMPPRAQIPLDMPLNGQGTARRLELRRAGTGSLRPRISPRRRGGESSSKKKMLRAARARSGTGRHQASAITSKQRSYAGQRGSGHVRQQHLAGHRHAQQHAQDRPRVRAQHPRS